MNTKAAKTLMFWSTKALSLCYFTLNLTGIELHIENLLNKIIVNDSVGYFVTEHCTT